MTDIIGGMASRAKFLRNAVSLSLTGNGGVWARRWRRTAAWRHIGRRRVRVMKKLDQAKVEWIIQQKRKNAHNKEIAASMGVSVRWVQKLQKRYKDKDKITYPAPHGQAQKVRARQAGSFGGPLGCLKRGIRGRVPGAHHKVTFRNTYSTQRPAQNIEGCRFCRHPAKEEPAPKWIRYEREHSNSMWHTDYK